MFYWLISRFTRVMGIKPSTTTKFQFKHHAWFEKLLNPLPFTSLCSMAHTFAPLHFIVGERISVHDVLYSVTLFVRKTI